jgi:hypothetical protein
MGIGGKAAPVLRGRSPEVLDELVMVGWIKREFTLRGIQVEFVPHRDRLT